MAYNVFLGGRLTGSMGAYFQERVGVGTASPGNPLDVQMNESGYLARFYSLAGNQNAGILIRNGDRGYGLNVRQDLSDAFVINEAIGETDIMTLTSAGLVGIGVTDPDSALEVLSTSSQLKLSYDGSNAAAFTVDSGGDIAIIPSGGEMILQGNLLPNADNAKNLGSASKRWANVYTGDLHLKNDRGDWTIVEEEDYLCVINNKTGKKYKMGLIPLEDDE
jgi:hypothetical protein